MFVSKMAAQMEVRVLQLEVGENLETKLFRLQKGWALRFSLCPALQPHDVHLFCNHPPPGQTFNRTKYHELAWNYETNKACDDGDRYAAILIRSAGTFHFYTSLRDADQATNLAKTTSGYFTVDPTLSVSKTETLPLDCISQQTVLSKCLGPLSQWWDRLRVGKESGYNVFHFTPIQKLGDSNSNYSLEDQLELNVSFNEPSGKKVTFDDVEKVIDQIRQDWKVLSIVDLVLNHTANNSSWLPDHPECAYNLENSPHLRPAYLLDRMLWNFSCEVADNKWSSQGLPAEVTTEHHVHIMGNILRDQLFPKLRMWEFFCVDVEKTVEAFKDAVLKKGAMNSAANAQGSALTLTPTNYKRYSAKVDMQEALKMFNIERPEAADEKERVWLCCEALKNHLQALNESLKHNEVLGHLECAIKNIQGGVRYERVDSNGPKYAQVSREHPLTTRYFISPPGPADRTIDAEEQLMFSKEGRHCMAHQGWIWGGDPLKDFAAPGSLVYLRRELIAWGDSVKLRYGENPNDAPFLWNRMLNYTQMCARLFDGIRLDNCHSTPLHVAEYFLDAARQVKPDLYVVAELFTGSEATDNIFVNRLGITSLIREAMSAHDAHEEGRLTYRYGGEPVGAFMHPVPTKPLVSRIAHALYMDVTHDNECPFKVRSVYDAIASSGLVAMACCASGSSRGYDELVPEHIHVVKEDRLYQSWPSDCSKLASEAFVPCNAGILSAKRAINELHYRLGLEGYSQVYVDQIHQDVHAITRHCPDKRKTVVLVARSAFSDPSSELLPTSSNPQVQMYGIPALTIPGKIEEIIFEAILIKRDEVTEFVRDPNYINGLTSHECLLQEHVALDKAKTCRIIPKDNNAYEVHFDFLAPGCVIAFDITMEPKVKQALGELRGLATEMYGVKSGSDEARQKVKDLHQIISKLSLTDLNRVLFRCDQEERDDGKGGGVYTVPNHGSLVYCGLQGFISVLEGVRQFDDLSHPLCGNLRDGNWMMDYTVQRLLPFDGVKKLGVWLDKAFSLVKECPRYLVPCYFDAIITPLYLKLIHRVWSRMSRFVRNGSSFVQALSLGSVQFLSYTQSASLPLLSPQLTPASDADTLTSLPSLAAGLPHFSTGFMRCWGRDTFIALRGLMLVPGRYEEAKQHILGYGGCVRHGLIPNLLAGGRTPRYNCRDATWWWLQCIQDYCSVAPNGVDILTEPVSRIFPTDDSEAQPPGEKDQPLHDVIQKVMQRHFIGISFRERGAGPGLDNHMTDVGFNVTAGVREETGFVYGGNQWNAGTWMDKVGESEKAGNRGVPATPRDGSAVEIVGLCKSTVRWLADLFNKKKFPYQGVSKLHDGFPEELFYEEWDKKIQHSFEREFWINEQPDPAVEGEDVKLVHRRGIYKDSVCASHKFADYQLRPNFCIAMTVAPEMFNVEHAWTALDMVEELLVGPLGMATLDPKDWAYEPVYDNSLDSTSYNKAKGFSYHQGPEWLWCLGFFLRARLHFAQEKKSSTVLAQTVKSVKETLANHNVEIANSPWRSLPELTNAGGKHCPFSCPAQAWSLGCLLDVLYDLDKLIGKNV